MARMSEPDSDELKRREKIVIDEFGGICPIYEAFYLESLVYAAGSSVSAFARYDEAVERGTDKAAIVAQVHEALSHAASVSRFFWPAPKKGIPPRRAEKLRETFELDETSPLYARDLRNALEHFDERLDDYLLGEISGYIFPAPMVDSAALADEALGYIFRLVDPVTDTFVLFGKKYPFGHLREAVTSVFERAMKLAGHGGRLEKPLEPEDPPTHEKIAPGPRPDFRFMAREAVERAKAELQTNDDGRLAYAALELRLALEALTYDRATVYEDEIPPEQYATWQPRKLMQLLLSIDPMADQTRSIRVGRQEDPGIPAKEMKFMGTDEGLSLETIKEHYDALSHAIHMPSLKQVTSGWSRDLKSLRARCDKVAAAVEKVAFARLFRSSMRTFSECACFRCEKIIKRTIPRGEGTLVTKCFHCGAPHQVEYGKDQQVIWRPHAQNMKCLTPGCEITFWLFDDDLRPEMSWDCPGCKKKFELALFVQEVKREEGQSS